MIKLTNLITEDSKPYDYGCVMLYTDFPGEIIKLQDTIDPNDLQDPGIEYEPHCTLLYGLHDDVTLEQVMDIVGKFTFPDLKAHNPSLFEKPEFDVFKYDIGYTNNNPHSTLHLCNGMLAKLPCTQTYPDYHPHNTIAYLKPGKGRQYVDRFMGYGAKEFITRPKYIVYSEANGRKTKIKI